MAEQIVCIYCGTKADIRNLNGNITVVCRSCKRKAEGQTYQKILDKWLDNIRKDSNGPR